MLAVAFAALDTLAHTQRMFAEIDVAAAPDERLAGVQENVRPYPATLRVLRELESLNVRAALVGRGPAWLVNRLAQVLWFRGDVVVATDARRFAAVAEWAALPPACVWYVTTEADDARAAIAGGMQAIVLDAAAPQALHEPCETGWYAGHSIDDVLEILRVPYTRSALNLRYIYRTVLEFPPLETLL